MSCTGGSNCDCGCCSGITVLTPQAENNRPGLSSISYRVGRWATFKESMLARSIQLRLSRAHRFEDARRRRLHHSVPRRHVGGARHPDLLPGASGERKLSAYRRATTVADRTVATHRLRARAGSVGLHLPGIHSEGCARPDSRPVCSARSLFPRERRCKAYPCRDRSRRPSRPRPTFRPSPTGMLCRCAPAHPGCRRSEISRVYLQGIATQLQPGDLILIVGDERRGSQPHQYAKRKLGCPGRDYRPAGQP